MNRLLLMLLAAALSCATAPTAARVEHAPRGALQLTYLGVAGWMISDGRATVLLDPYFSRGQGTGDDQTSTRSRRTFQPNRSTPF